MARGWSDDYSACISLKKGVRGGGHCALSFLSLVSLFAFALAFPLVPPHSLSSLSLSPPLPLLLARTLLLLLLSQVSKEGKKVFKLFVKAKGGIMPAILTFWLAAHEFSLLSPSDDEFSKDCKAIYKK